MRQLQHRYPLCAVIDDYDRSRAHTAKHTMIPSVSRKLLTKRNVFPHHVKLSLHNRHRWAQTRAWLMGLKRSTEQSNDVSGHQTHIDRWSCRHITRTHTQPCTPCTHLSESVHGRKRPGYIRSSGISYRVLRNIYRGCGTRSEIPKQGGTRKGWGVKQMTGDLLEGASSERGDEECKVCDGKSPGFVRITASRWLGHAGKTGAAKDKALLHSFSL